MTSKSTRNLLDGETGTLLSHFFDFFVEWEIKRSFRYQNFATLLIVEPEQKPQSPETIGTLASLIKKNVRETDVIGRIGKARFGILLLSSDVEGAYIIASRIMEHIGNYIFSHEKAQRLTLAIGGACFPINSTSIKKSSLFNEAEEALKVAKKMRDNIYFPGLPVLRTAREE
jgi:hypothetical protein